MGQPQTSSQSDEEMSGPPVDSPGSPITSQVGSQLQSAAERVTAGVHIEQL